MIPRRLRRDSIAISGLLSRADTRAGFDALTLAEFSAADADGDGVLTVVVE